MDAVVEDNVDDKRCLARLWEGWPQKGGLQGWGKPDTSGSFASQMIGYDRGN